MQEKPIFNYYRFGTCLRFLQDASEGYPLGTEDGSGRGAYVLGNLKTFFGYIKDLDLQVTARASKKLRDLHERLKTLPEGHMLTKSEAREVKTALTELRHTLDAELKGFSAFVVTPKRIDVRLLLSNVAGLLSPGRFDKLPSMARFDLTEAGMCIAFERPTAAAFHLMRGMEDAIKSLYASIVQRGRCELMWGPMIADLRTKRAGRKLSDLMNHLDHIRRSFRNPTQHPEKTYDIQEAQDLFSVCIDALNRIAAALP